MEFIREKNKEAVARKAADFLYHLLLRTADKQTLLLCSGGSSALILKYLNAQALRPNLSFALVDERFTPAEKDRNSFELKKIPFIKEGEKRGIPFISVLVDGVKGVEESADQYEDYLKRWRAVYQNGVIISLLGIGNDGHTAGIMRYPGEKDWFEEMFVNNRKWIVGYDTHGSGGFPFRVTVSPHFLLQEVEYSIIYACGKEKQKALAEFTASEGTVFETPARLLWPLRNATFCTDLDLPTTQS
jgi:6-phosphogluconolactonase/glucosamine-6-phosphate isomerase/deaminase